MDDERPSTQAILGEYSVSPIDPIMEPIRPTDVIFHRDYHAIIVVFMLLVILFAVIYLIYRCTQFGCGIFG